MPDPPRQQWPSEYCLEVVIMFHLSALAHNAWRACFLALVAHITHMPSSLASLLPCICSYKTAHIGARGSYLFAHSSSLGPPSLYLYQFMTVWLTLLPWRWRQQVPSKQYLSTKLAVSHPLYASPREFHLTRLSISDLEFVTDLVRCLQNKCP
jgi:hypothetical protein